MDMEGGDVRPIASGTAGLFTRRSPGKRTPSEDTAALLSAGRDRGLLVVADGVGGHAGGAEAAEAAVHALSEAWQAAVVNGSDTQLAILEAIQQAHRTVMSWGRGSATTILVADLRPPEKEDDPSVCTRARCYHAGDSMALLVNADGALQHHTVSHSPVGYAQEAGLLDEAEALVHEERHLVSNALGLPEMHIEVGPSLTLEATDTLVLGSDGLYDNLTLGEIQDLVRKEPVPDALGRLVEASRGRMTAPRPGLPCKPDDLTVVIWRPDGA